jgi:hypothetical protein
VWQQQPEPLLPKNGFVDLMWGKKGTGKILSLVATTVS